MSMSRKDYVKFAKMLAEHATQAQHLTVTGMSATGEDVNETIALVMRDIADIFAAENPNFDRGRFYAASRKVS